jgi:hypothetical protein
MRCADVADDVKFTGLAVMPIDQEVPRYPHRVRRQDAGAFDRDVSDSALQLRNVGSMKVCKLGQLLLAEAAVVA